MTIRFLNAKDGYAKGSVMSNLTPTQEAAYVASADAEYTAIDQPNVTEPVRRVLGQQGIPCILPGDGTVATNGTITVGVALALTYAQAWVYLPAGAVVGGLAGWYYTVFASTTVGQVYTAYQAAMDRPYIPGTLTAAVGSNTAYTQPLGADIVLGTITVPANLLGANGAIDVHAFTSFLTSANDKITKLKFGGSTVVTNTATTTTGISFRKRVQNRGTGKQVIHAVFETGAGVATTASQLAIDTTADVDVVITGQLETAAEYMVLESLSVEVVPAP